MRDKRPVFLTDQRQLARAGRRLPPVSPPAAGDQAVFARAGKVSRHFRPLSDAVELEFVFDFEPEELVVSVDKHPFPKRVFLLKPRHFIEEAWRWLLGYHHHGDHFRDQTFHSAYHEPYHKRSDCKPADRAAPPADSSARDPHDPRPQRVDRLVARVPVIELAPGVYEIPPEVARRFLPSLEHAPSLTGPPKIQKTHTKGRIKLPTLNTPYTQKIDFIVGESHFQSPADAEKILMGLVKTMRYSPELRMTLVVDLWGDRHDPKMPVGRTPAVRAYLNRPQRIGIYATPGQLMDARAKAVRDYLVHQGIDPHRIRMTRGGIYLQESAKRVIVIFSNQ